MITTHRSIFRAAIAAGVLLLVPFVAMQFTDEVRWSISDFIIAGAVLFGAGFAFDLLLSSQAAISYRVAFGIAMFATLLLLWANLAVGVVGGENRDVNLVYPGILLLGIAGAGVARLRARGMAIVSSLVATALVVMAGIVIALGLGQPESSTQEVLMIHGFFAAMFVASAWLFGRAARDTHGL
jgi:hypothetical protein